MPRRSYRIKYKVELGNKGKPRRVPTNKDLREAYMPAVTEASKQVKRKYNLIMRNWSAHNRPKIYTRSGVGQTPTGGYGVWSSTGTDIERTPLVWLEDGTSVRRRAMEPGFSSKTWWNSGTQTRAGRGGAINMWGFYPGIKPRNFRDAIAREVEPQFFLDANKGTTALYNKVFK